MNKSSGALKFTTQSMFTVFFKDSRCHYNYMYIHCICKPKLPWFATSAWLEELVATSVSPLSSCFLFLLFFCLQIKYQRQWPLSCHRKFIYIIQFHCLIHCLHHAFKYVKHDMINLAIHVIVAWQYSFSA